MMRLLPCQILGLPAEIFSTVWDHLSAEERVDREIEAKSTILDKLIENLLIMQEAKRFRIRATEEEIQKAVEDVRRKNRLTEKEFLMALSEIGLTIKAYTDNIEKGDYSIKIYEQR